MAVSMNDSMLFRGMFTAPNMVEIWDDTSLIQAWMDIWKAIAKVEGAHGIIPKEAADEIIAKGDVKNLDMEAIGKEVIRVGHALYTYWRAASDEYTACVYLTGHFDA